MFKTCRIALLEDHPALAEAYTRRLVAEPHVDLEGTEASGQALEALLRRRPLDVLLADISVPTAPDDPAPFLLLRHIPRWLEAQPNLAVLVATMHLNRVLIEATFEAGASGYVLKDDCEFLHNLAAILFNVTGGGFYLSPLAWQVLTRRDRRAALLAPEAIDWLRDIVGSPGLSIALRAARWGCSPAQVRHRLFQTCRQLGVQTMSEATAAARDRGWLTPLGQTPLP